MRAEALKLFRKLFLNKYARVINYFGLLCHTEILVFLEIEYFRTFRTFESTKVPRTSVRCTVSIRYSLYHTVRVKVVIGVLRVV